MRRERRRISRCGRIIRRIIRERIEGRGNKVICVSRERQLDELDLAGLLRLVLPSFDAALSASHSTAALLLLPYDTLVDERCWYEGPHILHRIMAASVPEHVVQISFLFFQKESHRQNGNVIVDWMTVPRKSFRFEKSVYHSKIDIQVRPRA